MVSGKFRKSGFVGKSKFVSEIGQKVPKKAKNFWGASYIKKYTKQSIVCEASCHPVTQSFGHLISQSFGHMVARSLGHLVTQSFSHVVTRSLGHSDIVTQSLGH